MQRLPLIVGIIAAVVILPFVALAILLANPDSYREEIKATIQEQTGFDVQIGELAWEYWPPIALGLSDLKIATEAGDVLSVGEVSVDAELGALLFGGGLNVNALTIADVTVNAVIDENGNANWEAASESTTAEEEASPDSSAGESASSGDAISIDVQAVDISNININYEDRQLGGHYTVTVPELRTSRIAWDEMITIATSVAVQDHPGDMTIDVDMKGALSINRGLSRVMLDKLQLVNNITQSGMTLLNLTTTTSGEVNLDGDVTAIDDLVMTLNDSTINGNLVYNAAIPRAEFDLTLDQFTVDDYLSGDDSGSESAGDDAAAATPTEDSEVIPVDALKGIEVDGKFTMGKLVYSTFEFTDFVLTLENGNGELRTSATMSGYEGKLKNESVTRYARAVTTSNNLTLEGVNVSTMAGTEMITGHINLSANHNMNGRMLSEVTRSLKGNSNFQVKDGTLDVSPIKSIASLVDNLRGEASGIGEWPDKMPFENLTGNHVFVAGTPQQTLGMQLHNIVIDGNGGFDLLDDNLKYDMSVQLSETGEFSVSPALANIRWPIHCEGTMSDSVSELCLPDGDAAKDLVAELAKSELKRQGLKKLDKLLDGKGDSVKDALKGLFNR